MKTLKITDDATKKTSELMAELKAKFKVYSYWDDAELDRNFLQPKSKTTREFPMEQESSDKNKSWNDLNKEYGDSLMSFREYILAFMKYHEATGKYLDEAGWTTFRDKLSGGGVASGVWDPDYGKVGFYRLSPDYSGPTGGGRVAISLNSSLPSTLEARVEALEAFQRKVQSMLILD
jgi:hypothetical protein